MIIEYFILIIIYFIYINRKTISFENIRNRNCSKKKILVTGSSSNHFHLLLLMLYNVYQYERDICFVVWDLGLLVKEVKKLLSLYITLSKNRNDIYVLYNMFNYSNYPSFFNIKNNAGEYAWKAIIISTTYYTHKTSLLWLDAGCNIIGSLRNVYNDINEVKIWSIGAGRDVKTYTHISTLLYLNASKSMLNYIMCAGGVVGLFYPHSLVDILLKKWVDCSLNKECIAPKNSNRSNHRQDQSAFTIIFYQLNLSCYRGSNKYNFTTHFDRYYRLYNNSDFYNKLK